MVARVARVTPCEGLLGQELGVVCVEGGGGWSDSLNQKISDSTHIK